MIPNSISASALDSFDECPARWKASSHNKAPDLSNVAAERGTACHGALEMYGKGGFYKDPSLDVLLAFLRKAAQPFGFGSDDLDLCNDMLERWYNRTDLRERKVISYELKETITIKVDGVEVPFNYIWDRVDEIGPDEYEVIDYKTSSIPLSPDDLRNNLQARAYGMAANMKWPNAKKIWVTFDYLRYEQCGVKLTRDENLDAYKRIKAILAAILASDGTEERINTKCGWCVRRNVCETLHKHVEVGGILGLTDPVAIAHRRDELELRRDGLAKLVKELDTLLLGYLEDNDRYSFDTDKVHVGLTTHKGRRANPQEVARILGPERTLEGVRADGVGVRWLDTVLRDPTLSDADRSALRQVIRPYTGEMKIKITPRKVSEES